jgi:hypothetical protein
MSDNNPILIRRRNNMFIKRSVKFLAIIIVAFAFASVATAYAASNTVPATSAGEGEGTISGYTVSAVHYNLNALNPGNIDSVTFTTDTTVPLGATVKIKLVNAGSTWYTCSGQGSTNISCATAGAGLLSADTLRIVIAD